jgi:hypothetical protein
MKNEFEPDVLYDVVFLGVTPAIGETRTDWKDEKGKPLGKCTVIYAGTHAGGICRSRSEQNCAMCKKYLCRAPLK